MSEAIDPDGATRWSPYFGVLTLILTVGLVLGGTWATYHAPGRNDQYQLIQLGQSVYHGGRMYVDAWENKPPGIAWLTALGLAAARGRHDGPWVVPAILSLLVLLATWASLRGPLGERTARKAVLVAALVYTLRLYDTPSINPDFYASIFELGAAALLIAAILTATWSFQPAGQTEPVLDGPSEIAIGHRVGFRVLVLCLLAGLLWASATAVKQVGCAGLLAFSACATVAGLASRRDFPWFGMLAATWAGFLLGIAAVAFVLWRQQTLHEAWHAVFTFNRDLFNPQTLSRIVYERTRIRLELAPLALPLWLGATAIFMAFWPQRPRAFPRTLVLALLLWWVAALVLACMGPSRTMRYWQATFPPMLMLAAVGLFHIEQVRGRLVYPERITFFVVAVTAAVLLARPALIELRGGWAGSLAAATDHPTEREQLVKIGDRVRELTSPGDRIYVLDYRPGIYIYADRLPAVRFNYPRSAEQMREIVAKLQANPPALLLLPQDPAPEFDRINDANYQAYVRDVLDRCDTIDKAQDYLFLRCHQREQPEG